MHGISHFRRKRRADDIAGVELLASFQRNLQLPHLVRNFSAIEFHGLLTRNGHVLEALRQRLFRQRIHIIRHGACGSCDCQKRGQGRCLPFHWLLLSIR